MFVRCIDKQYGYKKKPFVLLIELAQMPCFKKELLAIIKGKYILICLCSIAQEDFSIMWRDFQFAASMENNFLQPQTDIKFYRS